MFVDARTIPEDHVLGTDVCIIGAGAAGITLARELAGQPYRVSVWKVAASNPTQTSRRWLPARILGCPTSQPQGFWVVFPPS